MIKARDFPFKTQFTIRSYNEEGAEGGSGDETNEGGDEGAEGKDGDKNPGEGDDDKKPAKKEGNKPAEGEADDKGQKDPAAEQEAQRLRDEVEALKKKYEGIDPEEARKNAKKIADAEKAAREAERVAAEKEGNWERLLEIRNEEAEAERKAILAEAEEAKRQATELSVQIDRMKLENAFANSKFISDETVLTPVHAKRIFGEYVDVVEGELVVFDKPRGEARRGKIVDAKGEPKPFEDAIKQVVEADPAKDNWLKSKSKPGGNSSGREGKSTKKFQTSQDKIAAGLSSL